MSSKTTFEVHTLKGGQWLVDSTYPERGPAIEVARSLYGEKRYEAVKVIRDTFNTATGDSKESVIYDSAKPVREKSPPPAAGGEAKAAPATGAGPKADVDFRGGHAPAKKRSKDTSLALKAVIWLVVILLGGLGVLFLVSEAIRFLSKL